MECAASSGSPGTLRSLGAVSGMTVGGAVLSPLLPTEFSSGQFRQKLSNWLEEQIVGTVAQMSRQLRSQ